jgi:hypothetical protein
LDTFAEILEGSVDGPAEYLSAHVITCLVPALFIGGASDVLPTHDDSEGECL